MTEMTNTEKVRAKIRYENERMYGGENWQALTHQQAVEKILRFTFADSEVVMRAYLESLADESSSDTKLF